MHWVLGAILVSGPSLLFQNLYFSRIDRICKYIVISAMKKIEGISELSQEEPQLVSDIWAVTQMMWKNKTCEDLREDCFRRNIASAKVLRHELVLPVRRKAERLVWEGPLSRWQNGRRLEREAGKDQLRQCLIGLDKEFAFFPPKCDG